MGKLDGIRLNLPPGLLIGRQAEQVPHESIIARAGLEIWCPKTGCGVYVGKFVRDLYTHTTVAADTIEFAEGQKRDAGEYAACKKCGSGFLKIVQSAAAGNRVYVHTKMGWI